MKALLIVDVQIDFLPGGALAVPGGDSIIPVINALQPQFDLVVATQDWHPQAHKSFASNHEGKKAFDVINLNGLAQTLWPDHCVQGTRGAELSPELQTNKIEAIFRKGTDIEIDSYSGFYDNGQRKSTGLAAYLHGKGISQVYVTGLCGDICVHYTAMDSLKEGFDTILIEDGTCPLVASDFEQTKQEFTAAGGRIIHSAALMPAK